MSPRPRGDELGFRCKTEKGNHMIDNSKWTELQQAEDMAYFRANLCLYSSESYTLEEKRDICNEMISSTKAVLDAMRADFETYSPEIGAKLLDMLCRSGIETPEWWWDVLVGEGGPIYKDLSIYSHSSEPMRDFQVHGQKSHPLEHVGTCPNIIGTCPNIGL